MINWKLRLKNKTTCVTLITCVLAFIYQILSICGVTPVITEDQLTELIMMTVNLMCVVGIIVDPTTEGIGDSKNALEYTEPN